MKNLILHLSLATMFVFVSSFTFAQDMAWSASNIPPAFKTNTNITIPHSNANEVITEIRNYLDEHLKSPESLAGFYNADVTVNTSFVITTSGKLEKIAIDNKSDKLLGKIVIKELKNLSKVSPIVKDGKAVTQYVQIPVIFAVN